MNLVEFLLLNNVYSFLFHHCILTCYFRFNHWSVWSCNLIIISAVVENRIVHFICINTVGSRVWWSTSCIGCLISIIHWHGFLFECWFEQSHIIVVGNLLVGQIIINMGTHCYTLIIRSIQGIESRLILRSTILLLRPCILIVRFWLVYDLLRKINIRI